MKIQIQAQLINTNNSQKQWINGTRQGLIIIIKNKIINNQSFKSKNQKNQKCLLWLRSS